MFCWTFCGLFEFSRIRTRVIREGFLLEEVELGATYQDCDSKKHVSSDWREVFLFSDLGEVLPLYVSVTSSVKW